MGLFDKKYCDICGEKIGLLGNRKLEDGNLCKDCAKKLSPWFSDRRNSTVSEIKEQLAYREKNRERAAQFRTTRSYGEDWKLLLDEEHRWFTVTRARDLADANPDILDYTALTGCRVDIDESRTEQMREDADGKEVSYVPPRYEYSYDFDIIISVNHPYFDEMRFRLNDSSVYIEPQSTVQRPMMGQRPDGGPDAASHAGPDAASHGGASAAHGPPDDGADDECRTRQLRPGEQHGIPQVPRNGRRDPRGAAAGDGDCPRRRCGAAHRAGGGGRARFGGSGGRSVGLPRLRRTEQRKIL